MEYIEAHLPGPVPKNGETRIRILKTYTDPKSYIVTDGALVFDRSFGIRRDVVVLPANWEVTGSASPGIVSTQEDGRIKISFLNDRDDSERAAIGRDSNAGAAIQRSDFAAGWSFTKIRNDQPAVTIRAKKR